jgi:hypothetical protein
LGENLDRSHVVLVGERFRSFLPHPSRQEIDVIKFALAAALAATLATPAFAQAVIETPTSTTVIVPPGAPGVVTHQPGSTGDAAAATYSPTGRAADSIATDSAAAGNEGQPSRVGSTGSGGSK